jgi:hypothetical protein
MLCHHQNILLYIYIIVIASLLLSCTISKGKDPSTYRIPSPRLLWQRVRAPKPVFKSDEVHQPGKVDRAEMKGKDTSRADAVAVAQSSKTLAAAAERRSLLEHASVIAAQKKLEELGYPIKVGGRWPSGLPFLNQEVKGGQTAWETGIQLPLTTVNITELQVGKAI